MMNGLPQDIDLTPMATATVIQLSFGANQLQIHFDNASQIATEGACLIRERGRAERRIEQFGVAATALCRLIGQRTKSAVRANDGSFLLQFVNGTGLSAPCESEYGSFQLVLRGKTFVA